MSQSLDQLSLEELRSQLAEIQFKIEEKEKLEILGHIQEILSSRELPFLRALRHRLSTDADNFSPESPPVAPLSPSHNKKALKSGAYLRNGKVYLGIQEIKYVKYDKNNILRISKEGKGLPPRVDVFPDEIREVLLTLPLRTEMTETAEDLSSEDATSESQAVDSSPRPSEPSIAAGATPSSPMPEEADVLVVSDPLPTATSTELVSPTQATEEAPPSDAPRLRRPRTRLEASPPLGTVEKSACPAPPEPLQVSLF